MTFEDYCRKAARRAMANSFAYSNATSCYDTAWALLDVLEAYPKEKLPLVLSKAVSAVQEDYYNRKAVESLAALAFSYAKENPGVAGAMELSLYMRLLESEDSWNAWSIETPVQRGLTA